MFLKHALKPGQQDKRSRGETELACVVFFSGAAASSVVAETIFGQRQTIKSGEILHKALVI